MCLLCSDNRPLGFARALSRRSFVAESLTLGGVYAAARALGPVSALAQDAKADILIENAKVITLDAKRPSAEAIAIAGDTIIVVGARRELEAMRKPDTKVIDAQGRSVIPGLNDSHTHFI